MNKKLAIVVSGWHYPYLFYKQLKEQQIPKNFEIDFFVVSHRDPDLSIVYDEKQSLLPRFGSGKLQNLDKQLYSRIISKDEIKELGFIYNEEPNEIGDLFLLNQWVQRHYQSQYDYVMYTHDDTYLLNDKMLADIFEKKANLLTNPSKGAVVEVSSDFEWDHLASGVHNGTTCPRTSFTVLSKKLLDKIAPSFAEIATEGATLNRLNESDTPYDIKGTKINTTILGSWNAPGRNFWKWCEDNNFTNKSVRLSNTYRVTPYFIEAERGFLYSPDGEGSLLNYLTKNNLL
jgi:hypothetical protein